MDKKAAQHVLQHAAKKCSRSGSRLTDKRAQLLSILVEAEGPLSAYDVVEKYNLQADKAMPPMSAYRILDFLVSEQLAHKLASENKYIACSHIVCCDQHKVPQFLICRECHQVQEITIPREIIETLQQHVTTAGYQLLNSQLELDCICQNCMDTIKQ